MGLSDYNGFPGKMREQSLRRVHKLWDSGEVPRPERCDVCGQTEGAIHGHSEDYSNDHIHLPICITCHLLLHMRFQMPDVWERYKDKVREGYQGIPLEQRNALYRIKQLYGGDVNDWPMTKLWDARSATVLDMISPIKFVHPNAPHTAENTAATNTPTCPLDHIQCPWSLDDPVPAETRKTADEVRREMGLPRIGKPDNPFARP